MTLKQALAANRWLRAQFACLIVAVLYMPITAVLSAVFGSAWVLAPIAVYATAGGVCWVPARWTERALKAARVAAEREAVELRTPRAPDAGSGQCPVCGMDDLERLAADDRFMEREPDRSKVVPYGRRRAHWDCAEIAPYVPTAEEKARDTHFREHGQTARPRTCDWCFTQDERWEAAASRRRFERTCPELTATAERGARQIYLSHKADPQMRHWLLNLGAPTRHMDVLTIESCERAPDGDGWIAHLAEPLRHALYFVETYSGNIRFGGQMLMPLESERLWNREAGRPYTRTELGLCDCGGHAIGGGVTMAQVSDVLRAMGQGF